MNVARMRRLDRWLGVPVCLLLTLWRRLRFWRRSEPLAHPQRILFVKLAEQGSTVLAQPAFQAAVNRVGRGNVYFLCFSENRPVMDLLGLVPSENLLTINARGLLSAVVSAVSALWKLRRARIDTAIDLEFFARSSAALCFLSGARWRIGFHAFGNEAAYRGDLLTHRLSFNPYLHTSQIFALLVKALDIPADFLPTFAGEAPALERTRPWFRPEQRDLLDVRQMLRELLGEDQPRRLILLNANASDLLPLRRWPSDRYVKLARRLLARFPEACIAFTGASAEAAAAAELVRQTGSPRCVSLAGRTTLRQLLTLFCLADVLVTNDSGPAHFAALTPIQVVVLFGPETPRLFAAVSPRTHPLWAGLPCSPCVNAFNDRNSPCRDNQCMQALTVEQVFEQVCRVYQRGAEPAKTAGHLQKAA
jgi:ADP-heptose:LPS heptosyltransferase